MRRSAPMHRKTPLRPKASPKGASKAKKTKRGVYAEAEFSPEVRAAVARRSGGRCEARYDGGCQGTAHHMHHRQERRGGDGTEANALHVCLHCHLQIHAHPSLSYELGFMVKVNAAE